jgi:hypothetical protein
MASLKSLTLAGALTLAASGMAAQDSDAPQGVLTEDTSTCIAWSLDRLLHKRGLEQVRVTSKVEGLTQNFTAMGHKGGDFARINVNITREPVGTSYTTDLERSSLDLSYKIITDTQNAVDDCLDQNEPPAQDI